MRTCTGSTRSPRRLLTSLAHNLPGAAILLLCTYRPGYRASWLDLSYARQIPCRPLTASESADVVRGVLGDELPERLAEVVVARAEGNPFFAEELARALRDRQDQAEASAVPDSVHDVLAARIDGLPEATRRVLQTASVIGREFSPRLRSRSAARASCSIPTWPSSAPRVHLRAGRARRAPVRLRPRPHPRGRLPGPSGQQAPRAARGDRADARAPVRRPPR